MASTVKIVNIAMTKENLRQLAELADEFGESGSEVMKRALSMLYYTTFSRLASASQDDKSQTQTVNKPS